MPEQFKGLARFHMVTIGTGVMFCLLLSYRFFQVYRRSGASIYLVFAVVSLVGFLGLLVYLLRFRKTGISPGGD